MKTRFDYLLSTLFLVSAALNLFQLHQLRAVRAFDQLQPGASLPAITASRLDGGREIIPVSSEIPTVIYVFSPQCGWCTRNHENVIRLSSSLRDRYRFVGISLSEHGLDQYLAEHPLPFPVYQSPTAETVMAYRMGSTPQTIFLSKDGKVERAWNGILTEEFEKDLQESLKVNGD